MGVSIAAKADFSFQKGISKVYIMVFKNNIAGNAFWEIGVNDHLVTKIRK